MTNLWQRVSYFLATTSSSQKIGILAVVLLVVGLPTLLVASRSRQEIRQHASEGLVGDTGGGISSGGSISVNPNPCILPAGSVFCPVTVSYSNVSNPSNTIIQRVGADPAYTVDITGSLTAANGTVTNNLPLPGGSYTFKLLKQSDRSLIVNSGTVTVNQPSAPTNTPTPTVGVGEQQSVEGYTVSPFNPLSLGYARDTDLTSDTNSCQSMAIPNPPAGGTSCSTPWILANPRASKCAQLFEGRAFTRTLYANASCSTTPAPVAISSIRATCQPNQSVKMTWATVANATYRGQLIYNGNPESTFNTSANESGNLGIIWDHQYTFKITAISSAGIESTTTESTPFTCVAPTATPTNTPTPSPTPTGGTSNGTKMILSLNLIGAVGNKDHVLLHNQRNVTVCLYDKIEKTYKDPSCSNALKNITGRVNKTATDTNGSTFVNTSFDLGQVPTGDYYVTAKTNSFNRKKTTQAVHIDPTTPSANTVSLGLTPGDITGDNKVDIQDYSALVACGYGNPGNPADNFNDYTMTDPNGPFNSTACNAYGDKKPNADITDDGIVNENDYLFFIKSLSSQEGD